mmetsp:Transcript_10437/g.23678  ORF Transcript_10437/g.23678 Transcript_10437/m.23678 type:complete len:485 (+) Transcript_10437:53-1507(+)
MVLKMEGGSVAVLLFAAVALLSKCDVSSAAMLRSAGAPASQLTPPSGLRPSLSLGQSRKRRCQLESRGKSQLLAKAEGDSPLGTRGLVVADGFSRVACEVDGSPESQRVYFKDEACGDPAVKTCRLTELPMEPRLCFDFCRQYEKAKFFGLQGTKCYCTGYYHSKSVGGQGECDFACDGKKEEMCGGREKTSLFEMHLCADSAEEADMAMQLGTQAAESAKALVEAGQMLEEQLRGLAMAWKLDSCAIEPYGVRLCSLTALWNEMADAVNSATVPVKKAAITLDNSSSALTDAVSAAGVDPQAAELSAMELATADVREATIRAKGAVAAASLTMSKVNGPLPGMSGQDAAYAVFSPLADVAQGWHALCGLQPLPGQFYAASVNGSQAACSAKCLSLSSGTQACVGFNYVERGGMSTCQLLTAAGLVEPDDSLMKAVPIIEVSQSKITSMGITSLGCYAHGAFMAGHPQGPLKTKVIKSSTVTLM